MINPINEIKNKLKKEKINYNEYYEVIKDNKIKYMYIKIENSISFIVELQEFTEEQQL